MLAVALTFGAFLVGLYTKAPLARGDCPPQEAAQYNHPDAENCAPFDVLVARSAADFLAAIAGFIDRNRDDINAVSTVAIAIFTATLWWATQRQLRHLSHSIDLARDEFSASHPPHIIVRRVALEEGNLTARLCKVEYVVANVGHSRAIIYEGNATVAALRALPAKPPFAGSGAIRCPLVLDTGGSMTESVYIHEKLICDSIENGQMAAGFDEYTHEADNAARSSRPRRIYFFGYIMYRDEIGTNRRTAFCRVYDFDTGRFSSVDDPDYEYN